MSSAAVQTTNSHRPWRFLTQPSVLLPIAAVLTALLAGLFIVMTIGVSLPDAVAAFLDGAFGSEYAIGASINRAIVFSAIGLGFIFANRANLTNVGGEGQIAVAGIASAAVALKTGASGLPSGLSFILPMLAGVIAGAFWGGLCGVLKVKAGTNEVISSLLLTFIGVWLLYWCVQSVDLLRQPMTDNATLPETLEIPDATKLPALGNSSGPLNVGLIIIGVLAVAIGLILDRSVFGLKLRAVGLNELASRRAGISAERTVIIALAVAGAFGGLAGTIMFQGDQYVLKDGFTSGYGFDGLVVGLLARGSALGVILGGLFFGFLRSGGLNMEMVASVPSAVVVIIQGIVIITIAASAFWLNEKDRRA
jgi:general nucleoside transport system permease protein